MKTKNVCTQALNILKENPPKSVDNFQRGLDRYKDFYNKKKNRFHQVFKLRSGNKSIYTTKNYNKYCRYTHFSMGANKLVDKRNIDTHLHFIFIVGNSLFYTTYIKLGSKET